MNLTHGHTVGQAAARANETWQGRVHRLMLKGFGYEDISVLLGCRADAVRAEAAILDAEGRLTWLYTGRRA